MDGADAARPSKRRKLLALSDVTHLRTAGEIFGQDPAEDQQKALETLEKFKNVENEEENAELDLVEDEDDFEEEDEEYEDDSEGDYNAETLFENGEDYDDDAGDDAGDVGMM